MDITYLLFLQKFREGTEGFLAPIMDWVTKMSISFWPLALMLMLYWVCDRKAGRRMFAGMSLGYLLNGFLKLTFCVYRPWIRDARIEPFGDAKVAATGYSFPSGHSTVATIRYGSLGWWLRKRIPQLAAIFFGMIFLTMFSRNYLGVHTPQDVLVGFAVSAIMLVIANYLEKWSDLNPGKRDIIIAVAGITICIALVIYYFVKPYPMDYLSDGSLLVDPMKMLPDSFEGIGFVCAFVICRIFERKGFDFENELSWKDRFIIGIFALIPLMWWDSHIVNIFAAWDLKILGKLLWSAGIITYAMIIVPGIMRKVKEMNLLRVKSEE